jgi:long-subunit acyl-CoA synthetase (AMP-forming)
MPRTSPAISTLPVCSGFGQTAPQARRVQVQRNDQWISVSTDEFLLRVEELFFAIRSLGLRPHDRAVILSENRLEWAVADYATLCASATTVPIYPTFTAPQIEELLKHCEPAIIFGPQRSYWKRYWLREDALLPAGSLYLNPTYVYLR